MTTVSSEEMFAGSLVDASATAWNLGRLVKARYQGKAMLDAVGGPFDLVEFADAEKCRFRKVVEREAGGNEHLGGRSL